MASDDLHTRLAAEIERRMVVARAATPGPWVVFADPVDPQIGDMYWIRSKTHGAVTTDFPAGGVGHEEPEAGVAIERTEHEHGRSDAEYIALHDPADALRRYERDRRVLERHRPTTMGGAPLMSADECRCYEPWPCDEIRDLAESLGINVERGGVDG